MRRVLFLSFFMAQLAALTLAARPIERIAFGSCADQDEPQPVWRAVVDMNPDLWIWAGDNVYADTTDPDRMRETYGRLWVQPGYARLRALCIPILATWDDHDYGENDAGREFPIKQESQQIFLDFFGVPADSPRRARAGVYHAQVFGEPGQRVQVILLDTRYHRSPLEFEDRLAIAPKVYKQNVDPGATVLGEEQWKWLEARLREPADLRLIVSSIQVVAEEHRFEKWSNFPVERRRLFDLIRHTRAEGVVLLSGDRHHAELSRLDIPGIYPIHDLTSSGINKSVPRSFLDGRPPEPNRFRRGQIYRGPHFGSIDVDWNAEDPLVTLRIVNAQGDVPIESSFRLSELRFDSVAPQG